MKYFFWINVVFFIACSSAYKKKDINNNIDIAHKRIIAHRGAWKKNSFPENSIASLHQAIISKYAGSEFDVRMTLDDSLIINHDPKFHDLEIEKTKYNELIHYKLSNGEKLPTLREYLTYGTHNNQITKLICEIKPSEISKVRGLKIVNKVLDLVNQMKVNQYLEFISFDYNMLNEIAKKDKKAITYYLAGDKSPKQLKTGGIKGADYHYEAYNYHPNWIKEARENGILLNVWTVNDQKEMEWAVANNFDFITTNEPELLADVEKYSLIHQGWKLVYSDEFNYAGLPDTSLWSYDVGGHGWGNNEAQFYTYADSNNVKVKDGTLKIIALQHKMEQSNYTSAKLTTYEKFSMQYGKIECRAKLPFGKGSWPAIWMLPNSIRTNTEDWPLCGEIDIMEHVGKDPNTIHNSLHTFLYNHIKHTQITHFGKVAEVSNQFHVYGIEWDEQSIQFFIDNKMVYESKKSENGRKTNNEGWPFDKPYYFILNLAIGGNWGGEIDNTIFPNIFEIDYVRIYQK